MDSFWKKKIDPAKHPVRYAASIWQSRMKERFGISTPEFTAKQYGQMKRFIHHLGEQSLAVIDWSIDPVNWWHFATRARRLHKLRFVPDRPEVGFLFQYRAHARDLMNGTVQDDVA